RTPGRRDTHRVGRTRRTARTRRGIARGHGAWLSAAGAAIPGPHRCDERAAMARCLRPGPHSPTITAHMTSPYDIPQHDPADADHGPAPLRTGHTYSHFTTVRYLPTPGKAPAWPLADIGNWMIDANESAADWLVELRDWRREHLVRIGYEDANYRRPELQWAQRNFVHAQMMVEDRHFFDVETGEYTVDRYLDDLERRFGGLDSVLIWYIYPNIGIDDRNQFDLAHDLPGGLDGLKRAVDAF